MDAKMQAWLTAGHTTVDNPILLHYRDLGMDNDDLVLYLQVCRLQDQGEPALPATLARVMQVTEKTVVARLKALLQKGLMKINQQAAGGEYYDFTPLAERLVTGQQPKASAKVLSTGEKSRREVMQTLEAEFGRGLSAFEMETVAGWFDQDHFDPNMMLLAIQEAVANNARSLRYIEAILVNWQRDRLQSPQAVRAAKEKRRSLQRSGRRPAGTEHEQAQQGQSKKPRVPAFKFEGF